MSLLGAIIGGVASLGSTLLGMKTSSDSNKSAIAQQKLANEGNINLARENNNFNLEMWRRNNEYNSPSSQMQRYKDAGLNPALIYGSSGNAGNSSSPVTGTAARISALPPRDLTGVASYLIQGVDNLVNLAGKIEDIKGKKLNNSLLSYKEKYSDQMLKAGLDQVLLGNEYNRDTMESRKNSAYWRSIFDTSLAKEKENFVNDWQSRFLERQLAEINTRIGLNKERKGLTSWQAKMAKQHYDKWQKDIQLFDRERQFQLNNIDFADSNVWRGIDKGMNILSGLIDMFTGAIGGYSKIKGLFNKSNSNSGRVRNVFRHSDNGWSDTTYDYYE